MCRSCNSCGKGNRTTQTKNVHKVQVDIHEPPTTTATTTNAPQKGRCAQWNMIQPDAHGRLLHQSRQPQPQSKIFPPQVQILCLRQHVFPADVLAETMTASSAGRKPPGKPGWKKWNAKRSESRAVARAERQAAKARLQDQRSARPWGTEREHLGGPCHLPLVTGDSLFLGLMRS